MKLVIGADSAGFALKESIKQYLTEEGIDFDDLTVTDCRPYYETAQMAAKGIQEKTYQKAILLCGTGMGMSIVANKFEGVYASCVESVYAAEKCRAINNANVLCMGGFIVGSGMGIEMVKVFLHTEFTQGMDPGLKTFLHTALDEIQKFDSTQFSK